MGKVGDYKIGNYALRLARTIDWLEFELVKMFMIHSNFPTHWSGRSIRSGRTERSKYVLEPNF